MSVSGVGTEYIAKEPRTYKASKAEEQQTFDTQGDTAVGNQDLLGIGFFSVSGSNMKYGMKAEYAEDSAADNPIIKVTVQTGHGAEEYRIPINEVNPRNATEIEMFALLSYTDAQGISDGGSFGSYQRMKVYAENAEMNGHWEGNHSFDDVQNRRYDWQQIVIDMWDDYSDAGIYSQMLQCMNLNAVMEKFSIRFIDFDSITFIDKSSETSLHYEGPNVSEEVFKAWFEAAEETGADGVGMSDNGMSDHMFRNMLQRMKKWQRGDGNGDTSVDSITSALKAAKEALQALDYPLTSRISHSPEVQEELEKEKALYEAFIRKLEALQRNGTVIETGTDTEGTAGTEKEGTDMAEPEKTGADAIASKEDKSDYLQVIQEYIENLFTKLENGDTEVSYQIGGSAFTQTEWDELLEKFDLAEEEIRKLVEEEIEKRLEAQQEEKLSAKKRQDGERVSDAQMDMLVSETVQARFPMQEADEVGRQMEDLYLIAIDENGIRCLKPGQEEYVWEILFTDESQYRKAVEFLNYAGSYMDNYLFAAHENFWQDYLNGNMDVGAFQEFLKGTNNGIPDDSVTAGDSVYVDETKARWAQYMNPLGAVFYNF